MALAIFGLICIGLVGLGAVLSLRQASQAVEAAIVTTPVVTPQFTFTPSPTITPIPPTPTSTPEPTPTPTLVVGPSPQQAAISEPAQATLPPPLETPTETPTLDPNVTPTDTPNVTATNTLVLSTLQTATPTPAVIVVNPPAEIPQGGGILPDDKNFLIWAGAGLLLLLLVVGLINRSPGGVGR